MKHQGSSDIEFFIILYLLIAVTILGVQVGELHSQLDQLQSTVYELME